MSRDIPKSKSDTRSVSRAVALKYEGTDLPRVVATGQHLVAEQIVARAEAAGVPLVEDPALAEVLAGLDIGDHIPDNLFRAVAEVLSYALYVSGKHEDVLKRAQQTRDEAQKNRSNGNPKNDEPPE
ncbi:EscU/YscU/HrcU family type III secretion system export apparatus switch protein [Halothiobacillus sp.]|uniref:EscU/YscU/HrcU family type III secretion system export apparatus switch protein n=1 Tax=Halothiobacillus sp. TaxID=1891311 RepID=UPI00262846D5|nr:EscU/YscU/HrcU family type III secretion system export apparatus switch protein [Halothiobacillus sp.]MDD4965428.1 EscU/YscU/HrcU family type III secretion system export apparatus switch protein [Halothiobacillus sp.]